MKPRFSVHIAVYNGAPYIAQTLRALQADPDPDLDILVFDDASQDNSVAVIRQVMAEDKRIRLIASKTNYGIAGSRAQMLTETDADYIVVVDHDDLLLPLPRTQFAELFAQHPEISCIYGKNRHITENFEDLRHFQGGVFSRFNMFWTNMVCHPGSILRRSAVLEAGGYMDGAEGKKTRFGDFFLWARMCTRGELLFTNRYHVLYRRHARQASHQQSSKRENNYVADWMIAKHQPLYDALTGSGGELAPEDRRTAMLLLGILAWRTPITVPTYLEIVKLAESIDPTDYGVYVRRHTFYRFTGQNKAAFNECARMADMFADNPFVLNMALRLKRDLHLKLGQNEAAEQLMPQLLALQGELLDNADWDGIKAVIDKIKGKR